MRAWALLLGGLIVWTVHFFTLYAIASIFLTTSFARLLTILVTAACLIVDVLLLGQAQKALRGPDTDPAARWTLRMAALTAAISLVAVLWQGLPALLI